MTPSTVTVLSLMQWHHGRSESVSAPELASEARMTLPELRTCLEEVRKHLIESLWPTGPRAVTGERKR